MRIRFTKMHGLGNDFIVIDAVNQAIELTTEQVRRMADRHFGIGCDQILLVEAATNPSTDFRYRIYNSDGGEVEQCGNGARCFVRFVHEKHLSEKREIRVETRGGIIVPRLEDDGRVTVDMGVPRFEPAGVPFVSDSDALVQSLALADRVVDITALSMGNPHAVLLVDDVEEAPVVELGPAIENHPRFPQRVNAGFMQVIDRHSIRLRVYERGAGETLACGTGACAAAAAGIARGLLDSPVNVHTRGGQLSIVWPGFGGPLTMTGPAATVFDGVIDV